MTTFEYCLLKLFIVLLSMLNSVFERTVDDWDIDKYNKFLNGIINIEKTIDKVG